MSRPNASLHHDPHAAPELIERATAAVGSRGELAKRLGLTTEQLRLLCKGTHRLKYSVQFTLEKIIEIGEVDSQNQ